MPRLQVPIGFECIRACPAKPVERRRKATWAAAWIRGYQ